MKRVNSILLINGLLLLAGFAHAQSSLIFYGGSGDGHARGTYLQTVYNVNAGGSGDGWGLMNYAQNTINPNSGGTGDGWVLGSYDQFQLNVNAGGSGDGWVVSAYEQPVDNINNGGVGDGWSNGSNPISYVGPYRGGEGDGWASTYTPTIPLPITFLSFDAVKDGKTALLNWELARDEDVDYFVVERSSSAISFNAIGKVEQSATAGRRYDFIDAQPLAGTNYYRIHIFEKSGKASYTPTRVLMFDDPTASQLIVFPVPASTSVNVAFPQEYVGKNAVLNMYSVSGTMVRQMKLTPLKAAQIEMGISELADGEYIIHISGADNHAHTAKVTKISN